MAQLFEVTYNGCRRQLSRLNPTVLGALYRLEKTTIILIDADDTVFLWDEESFDKIETAKQPLTVEGVPLPSPSSSSDAPGSSFFSPSQASFRAPMPPPFSVPGSTAVRHPPPGNRFGSRQKTPTPQTKQLAVQRAPRSDNGKPGIPVQLVHIAITREEANVPKINEKLQAIVGFKDLVLCNVQGVPLSDDEATQKAEYWGFNRGGAVNGVRYFALPLLNEEMSDEGEGVVAVSRAPKRSRQSLSKVDLKYISETLVKTLNSDLSKILKPLLKCYWCQPALSFNPVVCVHCGKQVGCLACVQKWIGSDNVSNLDDDLDIIDLHPGFERVNHLSCPLCRGAWKPNTNRAWPMPNDLGYVKLQGFQDVISHMD
uniref:RING-type domain-containing protein n=1 Tax=Plectus sambesii TaxID=2011161 RepID=A0A914XA66_9BILA